MKNIQNNYFMKTIAVFHPSSELYGADRIMVATLKSFPSEKTKFIIYLREKGPLIDLIKSEILHFEIVIDRKMPIIYRALFSVKGIIQFYKNLNYWSSKIEVENYKYNFNGIYVNTLSCSFILKTLKRIKCYKFIHVHEIIDSPWIVGKVTAIMCNKYADYTICVSKAVKQQLNSYSKFSKSKIHIIHNGIKYPEKVDLAPIENGIVKFYLFGRINPNKGQEFLIDSIRNIKPEILKKSKFILVGGVTKGREFDLENLKNKINLFNLNDYIEIKGFTNDISSELKKANVCLIPSKMKDPFPTTVLEAMSYGKPIISTNHGGAAEIIKDGVNGYLVSPNNELSLSEKIKYFIENKDQILKYGHKSRDFFLENYTNHHFIERWKNFYTENLIH